MADYLSPAQADFMRYVLLSAAEIQRRHKVLSGACVARSIASYAAGMSTAEIKRFTVLGDDVLADCAAAAAKVVCNG